PYFYSDSSDIFLKDDHPAPHWMKAPESPFMQTMQYRGTAIVLFNHPNADPWPGRGADSRYWEDRDGHYNALRTETYVVYPYTMDEIVTYTFDDPAIAGVDNQRWYFLREGNTYIGVRTITGNTWTNIDSTHYKFR